MTPLGRAALDALPSEVARPAYALDDAAIGIVHLGLGAFHRAHQAVYVDRRLAAGEMDWAICGASLRSPDTCDALARQDGLYCVAERSDHEEKLAVIGSIRRQLVAPRDPEALLAAMADPAVRIISLTITEKGYCLDPSSGDLNQDHADIRADLASPSRPVSAPGFLVEAIRRRRASGIAPFTVLCCDNLPNNGRTVGRAIAQFAGLRDRGLADFIAAEIACPSTMVDRIVPATTQQDRDIIASGLGHTDEVAVLTEPFMQWVIEDHFAQGRPCFEEAGAQMVGDVTPYELMKLRLLNGSHSMLAYLGYLAGFETIAATVDEPAFAALAGGLMEHEASPSLPALRGFDLAGYRASLLERFANPALRHRTWQIAMDGSQKLPQRLLETARARLAAGAPIDRLALAVAGWMRYVTGIDEEAHPIDVRDPMSARLKSLADAAGPVADRLAPTLLSVREIFGADLPADPRFAAPVTAALQSLFAEGAKRTVADLVDRLRAA